MKKLFLISIMSLSMVYMYAQENQRMMEIPAKQAPVPGQSLYVFTVNMSAGKSVVISIDDNNIGHFFNGETAEITVPNGRHIVRAYQMQWDKKNSRWKDDSDDRLTDTLNGERFPVSVAARLGGVKLSGGKAIKLNYDSFSSVFAAPSSGAGKPSAKPGIEGAVARASVAFIGELSQGSTIAVINISSNDHEMTTFAIDELEYQLVISKQFTMVDRKTLETVRTEQHFQTSGEVSEQSAVSIGNLLGASIVITGNISGIGNTQRLTLKALNVKTAQIITMAREQF